jgi:hypothetical protein
VGFLAQFVAIDRGLIAHECAWVRPKGTSPSLLERSG